MSNQQLANDVAQSIGIVGLIPIALVFLLWLKLTGALDLLEPRPKNPCPNCGSETREVEGKSGAKYQRCCDTGPTRCLWTSMPKCERILPEPIEM